METQRDQEPANSLPAKFIVVDHGNNKVCQLTLTASIAKLSAVKRANLLCVWKGGITVDRRATIP